MKIIFEQYRSNPIDSECCDVKNDEGRLNKQSSSFNNNENIQISDMNDATGSNGNDR